MSKWEPKGKTDYGMLAADAAVKWWESKRPEGWTVYKHLGTPDVGLMNAAEKALAFAAANWAALYWGVLPRHAVEFFNRSGYVTCPRCGRTVKLARGGYTWRHTSPSDGHRHRVRVR